MKLPALITNVLPLHENDDDDDNYLMIVYKCKCMVEHLVSKERLYLYPVPLVFAVGYVLAGKM